MDLIFCHLNECVYQTKGFFLDQPFLHYRNVIVINRKFYSFSLFRHLLLMFPQSDILESNSWWQCWHCCFIPQSLIFCTNIIALKFIKISFMFNFSWACSSCLYSQKIKKQQLCVHSSGTSISCLRSRLEYLPPAGQCTCK